MKDLELMTIGFNAGYILQKYDPELVEVIRVGFANEKLPFVKGFFAGIEEYIIERTRKLRESNKDINDDIEHE